MNQMVDNRVPTLRPMTMMVAMPSVLVFVVVLATMLIIGMGVLTRREPLRVQNANEMMLDEEVPRQPLLVPLVEQHQCHKDAGNPPDRGGVTVVAEWVGQGRKLP